MNFNCLYFARVVKDSLESSVLTYGCGVYLGKKRLLCNPYRRWWRYFSWIHTFLKNINPFYPFKSFSLFSNRFLSLADDREAPSSFRRATFSFISLNTDFKSPAFHSAKLASFNFTAKLSSPFESTFLEVFMSVSTGFLWIRNLPLLYAQNNF